MSARLRKKGNGQKPLGFYVYCVAEHQSLEPLFAEALPDAIESDATLEMITQDKLAAVVSPVPLSEYGEEELPRHLTDATWTAIRAMRHERVAEHFARRASVVPLRFGTIYRKRERVEQMLAERSAELKTIIERLQGREEWGLNLYFERSQFLEQIVSLSPRLREMSREAESASTGQAYLIRKKIEGLRQTEARTELKRIVTKIERELGVATLGSKRLRVLKDEATERGELAAKFALLIERTGFNQFHTVAERLAEELADAGLQIELTGPWPAYNFANE